MFSVKLCEFQKELEAACQELILWKLQDCQADFQSLLLLEEQRFGLIELVFQVEFLIFCGFFWFRQTSKFKTCFVNTVQQNSKAPNQSSEICTFHCLLLHVCKPKGCFLLWWNEGLCEHITLHSYIHRDLQTHKCTSGRLLSHTFYIWVIQQSASIILTQTHTILIPKFLQMEVHIPL